MEAELTVSLIIYEAIEEEPRVEIDLSCFSGNLRRDDREKSRDCWRIADGNNFRVRSRHFCYDKSKVCKFIAFVHYVPV